MRSGQKKVSNSSLPGSQHGMETSFSGSASRVDCQSLIEIQHWCAVERENFSPQITNLKGEITWRKTVKLVLTRGLHKESSAAEHLK
jgi:hypothetical protein